MENILCLQYCALAGWTLEDRQTETESEKRVHTRPGGQATRRGAARQHHVSSSPAHHLRASSSLASMLLHLCFRHLLALCVFACLLPPPLLPPASDADVRVGFVFLGSLAKQAAGPREVLRCRGQAAEDSALRVAARGRISTARPIVKHHMQTRTHSKNRCPR